MVAEQDDEVSTQAQYPMGRMDGSGTKVTGQKSVESTRHEKERKTERLG